MDNLKSTLGSEKADASTEYVSTANVANIETGSLTEKLKV